MNFISFAGDAKRLAKLNQMKKNPFAVLNAYKTRAMVT